MCETGNTFEIEISELLEMLRSTKDWTMTAADGVNLRTFLDSFQTLSDVFGEGSKDWVVVILVSVQDTVQGVCHEIGEDFVVAVMAAKEVARDKS